MRYTIGSRVAQGLLASTMRGAFGSCGALHDGAYVPIDQHSGIESSGFMMELILSV